MNDISGTWGSQQFHGSHQPADLSPRDHEPVPSFVSAASSFISMHCVIVGHKVNFPWGCLGCQALFPCFHELLDLILTVVLCSGHLVSGTESSSDLPRFTWVTSGRAPAVWFQERALNHSVL